MKLKRIMAFTLAACLMTSSMTVFAAREGENKYDFGVQATAPDTDHEDAGGKLVEGDTYHTSGGDSFTYKGGQWTKDTKEEQGGGTTTTPSTPGESSSSSTVSAPSTASAPSTVSASASAPAPEAPKVLSRQDIINIVTRAETIAMQAAARDEGFADMVDMQIAAAKNMSAGEYYNNAVVETIGIEEATPVAQGGGIIINGVVTNVMATISKVDVAFVDSVRASVEGTVLNVVDVSFPAVEATINFYMPGVTADANIVAVQYVKGAWVDVEVAEVRADHVVLNLKQNGKVAFLAK